MQMVFSIERPEGVEPFISIQLKDGDKGGRVEVKLSSIADLGMTMGLLTEIKVCMEDMSNYDIAKPVFAREYAMCDAKRLGIIKD